MLLTFEKKNIFFLLIHVKKKVLKINSLGEYPRELSLCKTNDSGKDETRKEQLMKIVKQAKWQMLQQQQ